MSSLEVTEAGSKGWSWTGAAPPSTPTSSLQPSSSWRCSGIRAWRSRWMKPGGRWVCAKTCTSRPSPRYPKSVSAGRKSREPIPIKATWMPCLPTSCPCKSPVCPSIRRCSPGSLRPLASYRPRASRSGARPASPAPWLTSSRRQPPNRATSPTRRWRATRCFTGRGPGPSWCTATSTSWTSARSSRWSRWTTPSPGSARHSRQAVGASVWRATPIT